MCKGTGQAWVAIYLRLLTLIRIFLVFSKNGSGFNIFPWNAQNFLKNAFPPCLFDFSEEKQNQTFKNKLLINCSFRKCIGVMFLVVLLGIFLVKFCSLKRTTNLTGCLTKISATVTKTPQRICILLFNKQRLSTSW